MSQSVADWEILPQFPPPNQTSYALIFLISLSSPTTQFSTVNWFTFISAGYARLPLNSPLIQRIHLLLQSLSSASISVFFLCISVYINFRNWRGWPCRQRFPFYPIEFLTLCSPLLLTSKTITDFWYLIHGVTSGKINIQTNLEHSKANQFPGFLPIEAPVMKKSFSPVSESITLVSLISIFF